MKILGLGNALVDVLLRLEDDVVLSKIGICKGAMEMIDQERMIAIRTAWQGLERTMAPGGSVCNTMRAISMLGGVARAVIWVRLVMMRLALIMRRL